MNSLFEMEQNRSKADKRYDKRNKELCDQIEALETKRKKLKFPHLIDYLNKLGKEIVLSKKIKGAVGFEVMGPFGMDNETSIYFYAGERDSKRKPLAGATFARLGDGYGLKDYSKNTGQFAEGSIGELNGGNYKTIEITEKMTLDWFIRFAKKGYNK